MNFELLMKMYPPQRQVKTEKKELEATLSIVHSDFERNLEISTSQLRSENEKLKKLFEKEKETVAEVLEMMRVILILSHKASLHRSPII
jgi:hypothetical protein